jgi:hypothetical protein
VVVFRGPGASCRVAATMPVRGRRGRNVVRLDGTVRGERLDPGVFRVEVLDTTRGGHRLLGRLAVAIRYDARGRAHVRQVPMRRRACPVGLVAATSLLVRAEPPALRRTGDDGVAAPRAAEPKPSAGGDAEAAGPLADDDDSGFGAGIAAVPRLDEDAAGGIFVWVLVALFLVSAGAFLAAGGQAAYRALRR